MISGDDVILFEDDNYRVESGILDPSRPVIVSFCNYNVNLHPTKKGDFGKAFGVSAVASLGFNSVALTTNRNDWYQNKSVLRALDSIKRIARKGTPLITYGSSMGGFAAINFSEYLQADFFLAISPQFTIDREFFNKINDRRWAKERELLEVTNDFIAERRCGSRKGVIVYDDKLRTDAEHASWCAKLTEGSLIALPFSGHPSGPYFNRIYGLKKLLAEIGSSSFDLNEVRSVVGERGRSTLEFLASSDDSIDIFFESYIENPTSVSFEAILNLSRTLRTTSREITLELLGLLVGLLTLNRNSFSRRPSRIQRVRENLVEMLNRSKFSYMVPAIDEIMRDLEKGER